MINVLVWNEYIHEKNQPEVAAIYPEGIHHRIGKYLEADNDISVKYATLDMENNGITKELLDDTDVLIWWGHQAPAASMCSGSFMKVHPTRIALFYS